MKIASLKSARNFLLAALVLSASHQAGAQTLLTYWNFNNTNPAYNSGAGQLGSFSTTAASYGEAYSQANNSTPGTLASNTSNSTVFSGSSVFINFSNINSGNITNPTINGKKWSDHSSQAPTSDPAGYGSFLGSTTNAVGSDTAGNSLILLNTGGNLNNKYITFSLSSSGYEDLSLTYGTRLTNSVSASQVWSYSLDGTNYFSLTTISPTANGTFTSQSLDLSTLSANALDNQSTFYLRMTYTSANSQGSQAFDNIQLVGTAVPEPTTIAFALGGLGFVLIRTRIRARNC